MLDPSLSDREAARILGSAGAWPAAGWSNEIISTGLNAATDS